MVLFGRWWRWWFVCRISFHNAFVVVVVQFSESFDIFVAYLYHQDVCVCFSRSHGKRRKHTHTHEKGLLIVLLLLSLSSSQLLHCCLLCAAEQQPISEEETTVTSSFLIISIQLFYYSFMVKTHSFWACMLLLLRFVRHKITQKYK